MTTYELPPEPPIGSQLRDPDQRVWERTHDGWTGINYAGRFPWSWIMARSPLTLIEPDPWPTAPLIVANMGIGRELFTLNYEGAYESRTYYVDSDTDEPLTNVVPVTVVPVAEMRHAREMLAAADAGDFDSFIGSFRKLIAATDALGLDQ